MIGGKKNIFHMGSLFWPRRKGFFPPLRREASPLGRRRPSPRTGKVPSAARRMRSLSSGCSKNRRKGFDLRCGGGRVAALTCPRHVIHSRSRANPSVKNQKAGYPNGYPAFWHAVRDSNPCEVQRFAPCFATFFRFAQKTLRVLRSGVRSRYIQNAKCGAPEWVSHILARRKGFEPLTFWSVARRSIQLS